MTMDVSRLGIVVESKGIDEARKALDGGNGRGGLFGAAEKAEKAVTKLTDSLGKMLNVNAAGTTTAWNSALSQLGSTLGALNSSIMATTTALRQLAPAMSDAGNATNQASQANERKARSGTVVTNTLKAMTTAALAYVSINMATSVVKQADSWQMMEARLQNATHSLNNARVAQQQMYDLAQRLRVPIEETVKLYTRLAPAMQRAGKSSEYAKEMVEGIATALQLGGANGAETSSVMLQLSQSFSSGVLNGAEFNAVAENGSVLMRALEKSTGKSTAELKKLGSEGKLSMEIVGKAIQQSLPEWRKQFDLLPLTFEGAITRLKNAWTKGVGELGQSTGFNAQLSAALGQVEKLIPMVLVGLGNAFSEVMSWIEKNKDKIDQMAQAVGVVLAQAWELVSAFAQVSGDIAAAGDKVSPWAVALKGVAYFVAAIADGFRVIAGFITIIGAAFAKTILMPFQGFALIIQMIMDGVSGLLQMTVNGLRAIGKGDAADRMQQLSDSVSTAAQRLGNANYAVNDFLSGGAKLGAKWIESIGEGDSALLKLWNTADKTQKKISTIADLRKMEKGYMDEGAWGANPNPKTPVDPKVAKAAENEVNRHASAVESLNAKLEDQLMLTRNLEKDGLNYDKITPAMKEANQLQGKLNKLIDNYVDGKATEAQVVNMMIERDLALEVARNETINEQLKERLQLEKSFLDKQQTTVNNIKEQALEAERKLAAYGQEKGAIEQIQLAEAERALAAFELLHGQEALTANEAKMLSLLQEQVDWAKRLQVARNGIGENESAKAFDKLFDPRKAEKFGDVLANGFGKAGKALGQLANAMGQYEKRQAKISQGRVELEKMNKASAGYAERSKRLVEEETESRIASYADMAGAAKGFFEEGSKGYKVLEAAEKTFRAFQLAMQIKSFVTESGFIEAITALFVTSKATETTAEVASVGPHVAAEGAKQSANAITALTSALAAPFPANIPAFAMVAAMLAAIGVAVSGAGGGGGMSLSQQRQKSQGTGTVMGDSTAQSESISKSLELLSKNSDIALRYSSGMLSSLQNIEYSLTGATNGIIRTGNSVTGKDFQNSSTMFGGIGGNISATLLTGIFAPIVMGLSKLPMIGGLVSKLVGGLFGGSSTLVDSGLLGKNQSVANILEGGFSVQGYQDVQTKKKAFGITYSNKTSTNTSAVDPSVSREFGNIINGMVNSLVGAASSLGMSGDEVRKKLEAVNIDIGKISLKGLSSEEIQKQLEAVFSAIGDKLSAVALPSMAKFQKAGEGLLETAVRVATGVEQAKYELEKLGMTAVDFNSLTNTTGDIGAEIVRATILLRESGTGVGEIISTLSGSAGDIASTYKSLVQIRDGLVAMGIASDVSRELIRAAGGLDALQSALEDYQSKFFSQAEQSAMKTASMRKEFEKLGLAMPSTREGFRKLVEQLSSSGAAGQELAVKVIALAGAFADLTESTDGAIASARDDLSSAYERESSALADAHDKFAQLAESLKDFKTSLLTGDLSTLNVADKYQVEKAKFEDTLAKAKAGDENALNAFQGVAESFLQASRAMNASNATYVGDFQNVLDATDALANLAGSKASVAQQQLDALKAQVKGLIDINDSVLTVAQAIQNLQALLVAGNPGPTVKIPTQPVGPSIAAIDAPTTARIAAVNSDAMVVELAALRAEVAGLRQDQSEQTGAIIESNFVANQMNAESITTSAAEQALAKGYSERAQVTLA